MNAVSPRPFAIQPATSLPLYDLPEVREATDLLWRETAARLQGRGVPAPLTLAHGADASEPTWRDPNLLLSQACAYRLMTDLDDEVSVLGAGLYRAPACEGPFHRSAVVVRTRSRAVNLVDLKGLRCALDDRASNVGMNLLRAEVSIVARGEPFFSEVVDTASPLDSIEAVAEGCADAAAIDAVTYALLQRHRPALTGKVRLLFWTIRCPGPPFITRRGQSGWIRAALHQTLAEVAADPALKPVRDALLLSGFSPLRREDYRPVARLAQLAAASGYPELR